MSEIEILIAIKNIAARLDMIQRNINDMSGHPLDDLRETAQLTGMLAQKVIELHNAKTK